MHKLVYGLGGGLVYSCGGKGGWKNVLPKLLKTFDNAYLYQLLICQKMPPNLYMILLVRKDYI